MHKQRMSFNHFTPSHSSSPSPSPSPSQHPAPPPRPITAPCPPKRTTRTSNQPCPVRRLPPVPVPHHALTSAPPSSLLSPHSNPANASKTTRDRIRSVRHEEIGSAREEGSRRWRCSWVSCEVSVV